MGNKIFIGAGCSALALAAALFFLNPQEGPDGSGYHKADTAMKSGESTGSMHLILEPEGGIHEREFLEPEHFVMVPEIPVEAPSRAGSEEEAGFFLRVLTEAGSPIPGAKIRLYRRPSGQPIDEAVSRETGEAVVLIPRPGDEIEANAHGFAINRLALGETPWPDPYPIVLKKGIVFLEGWVVDDHQVPVASANLYLDLDHGFLQAETAPDGTFSFFDLESPKFPVEGAFRVFHPQCCFLGEDRIFTFSGNESPVMLMAHRWARLRVRVQDPSGRPLDQVRLRLAGPPAAPDRFRLPGIPAGETIRIKRLIPGQGLGLRANAIEPCFLIETAPPMLPLWLMVDHSEYRSKEVEISVFEPGEEREVVVRLTEPSDIQEMAFQVLDPEGGSVAGLEASYRWSPGEGKASQKKIHVEKGGVFRLVPPSARWNLLVTAPGFAPLRESFHACAQGPSTQESGMITLTMIPSESMILVLVHDQSDKPVPDLRITLADQRISDEAFWKNLDDWGSVGGFIQITLSTDEEGEARFRGLDPEGRYTVNMGSGFPGRYFHGKHEGTSAVPSPASYSGVSPSEDALRFRLVPPASLKGRILKEGLEGTLVFLSCISGLESVVKPSFTINSILGPGGAFFFDGLPSGRYHLYVQGIQGGDDFKRPLAGFDLGEGERLSGVVIKGP